MSEVKFITLSSRMILGFYYHIPVGRIGNLIRMPGYLGLFVDSLANVVDRLILFMHEAHEYESDKCDYSLKQLNIELVSLGIKTPAWDRFLWPLKTLNQIRGKVKLCDHLLVRAPSPLAPAFFKLFNTEIKISYLVVGDYIEGAKYLNQPWYRKIPIRVLSKINDVQLTSALKQCKTLVNSQKLFNKYRQIVPDLHQVKTTTLTNNDFFKRYDTCQGDEIKILFVGSFSFAKGLRELVKALSILIRSKKNVSLHLVGWDYDPQSSVEVYLKYLAIQLGIKEYVFFHGFKKIGPELNEMYRMADIYILPSYHEGFPRSIWEAMANSLPVIATRVGSIPYYLKDRKDALLIKPENIEEIASSVIELIENEKLRIELIVNGFNLAKQNTLETQAKRLINILSNT